MTNVLRGDRTPGEFRTQQVAIGSNKRFVPPPQTELDECLHDFENYLHQQTSPDPLIHCFVCHYQFETIHPFHDGNGRVGRLLLALMLKRLCGLTKPWLYLSDVLEKRRDDYCNALFEVSTNGNWSDWLGLCLNSTIEQANLTIQRCEKLNALKTQFTQRINERGGTTRLHQVVNLLFQSPFVRVSNLHKKLGVSYPTAKSDCERLVECGILSELQSLSPITYYAKEIFEISYSDID